MGTRRAGQIEMRLVKSSGSRTTCYRDRMRAASAEQQHVPQISFPIEAAEFRRNRSGCRWVEELNRLVRDAFGGDSEAIIAAYRQDYPKATPFGLCATMAASQFRIPAFAQATTKAAQCAAPAYAYIYAWRTPVLDNHTGTFHAAEISFTFDNAKLCDQYSAGDPAAFILSRQTEKSSVPCGKSKCWRNVGEFTETWTATRCNRSK